ncbi:RDD family protein [Bacillus sp. FJAT-42376]|uniref:RDD family protein n=1 Tax=Bacillus sp. FJAT-42376 TaxID=2014076 RepID=UPI0013DDCCBD|nr:RDD family protein [Bacillus sp. FJAT-42376]
MEYPVKHAGFWLRFAAYVIDGFIVSIFMYLFIFLIAGAAMGSSILSGNPDDINIVVVIAGYAFFLLVVLAYYIAMPVTKWQGTIGKKLVGIKIVDRYGQKLTIGKSVLRYLSMIVTGFTFGVGYIITAFTERKQALHDLMVKTYVIQSRIEVQPAMEKTGETGSITHETFR